MAKRERRSDYCSLSPLQQAVLSRREHDAIVYDSAARAYRFNTRAHVAAAKEALHAHAHDTNELSTNQLSTNQPSTN
eukprot:6196547-Pleurochrysis_carterae.AAC.3